MLYPVALPSVFVRTRLNYLAFAVAAGLVVAWTAGPAAARDDHFHFRYKAHELETAGGARSLYARLQSRVERFCAAGSVSAFPQSRLSQDCMRSTLAEVVGRIDHPNLYAAQSGDDRFARR